MNFTDTLDNSPTDLIGSKYGVVVFAAKDFDDWCESLAIAHDDEVYIASNAYLEDIPDERLTKNGLVRLPVDADGVTIRVGDTLDGYGKTIEVVEMRYGRGGWVLISRDGGVYAGTFAFEHHEPTVEDVLREFAEGLGVPVADSYVAATAAKLRLAGEDA